MVLTIWPDKTDGLQDSKAMPHWPQECPGEGEKAGPSSVRQSRLRQPPNGIAAEIGAIEILNCGLEGSQDKTPYL